MGGFAGLVDYNANFLYDIPAMTRYLWVMAGALGGGCYYGVDVLEDNAAFVQNSCVPMLPADYHARYGDHVYYLFAKGVPCPSNAIRRLTHMGVAALSTFGGPFTGVYYMVAQRRLFLFRGKTGAPVYYAMSHPSRFLFATAPQALGPDCANTVKPLEQGLCAIFDEHGLFIRSFK